MADLTKLGTWALGTVPPGISCTIGAATGVLNITALTIDEVYVPVTFTYGGLARPGTIHVVRVSDQVTSANAGGSGGSSGTTATTSTLGATTGTIYDPVNAVSAKLQAVAGSGGQVALSAPLSYKRSSTSAGFTGAAGKWQWRVVGGTWADVTTETVDTTNYAQTDANPGDPVVNLSGSLTVNATKTGLTAGTTYEFQFLWREVAISGGSAHIYRVSGTLQAAGS